MYEGREFVSVGQEELTANYIAYSNYEGMVGKVRMGLEQDGC